MSVRVDEPWRHHAVAGVDYLVGEPIDITNPDDFAVGERDITVIGGAPVPSTKVPFLIKMS
jgi:hypothetical protein